MNVPLQSTRALRPSSVALLANLEPVASNVSRTFQKSTKLTTPGYFLEPYQKEVAYANFNNIALPASLIGKTPASFGSTYTIGSYNGRIYIPNYDLHRVEVIDSNDLTHVATFGSSGTGNGQMSGPMGICCDGTHLFVSEYTNNRIQKILLSDYSYVAKAGSSGTGDGQFNGPVGICTDGTYLYVADHSNHRIQIFNKSDLSFVAKIGGTSAGTGDYQFTYPYSATYCGNDILIVADYGGHRLMKYTASTRSFLSKTSASGTAIGQIRYPTQIGVYGDYIFVAEETNKRIQKFLLSTLAYSNVITFAENQKGLCGEGEYAYAIAPEARILRKLNPDTLGIEMSITGSDTYMFQAPIPDTVGFGWDGSAYEDPEPLPYVTFSPASGDATVPTSVSLSISPADSDVTIRYSTDGSDVTVASTAYTTAISVTTNPTTIRARATKGARLGPISNATYANYLFVNAPKFSRPTGKYSDPFELEITCATPGVTIYYTTNGTTPNGLSTQYTGPIAIGVNTVVKAIAIKNSTQSTVTSANYIILLITNVNDPVFSKQPGVMEFPFNLSITCTTPDALIYYTLDGSDPDAGKIQYTGEITIEQMTTVKAIAIRGALQSNVVTASYFNGIVPVVPPVIFSHSSGIYKQKFSLSMTSDVPQNWIFYTIDGSTPTLNNSITYTAPITIASDCTVKAIAYNGGVTSEVNTVVFDMDIFFVTPPSSEDRTGPWNKFYPDGITDYRWRIKISAPSGGLVVKAIEIYQLNENATTFSGEFWSTACMVKKYDIYGNKLPGYLSSYNLKLYQNETAINTAANIPILDLIEGEHVYDAYGTINLASNGNFVMYIILMDDSIYATYTAEKIA